MKAQAIALALAIMMPSVAAGHPQVRDTTRGASAGTGEISGVVVSDKADGIPVRRATVTLQSSSAGDVRVVEVTDESGRFRFSQLDAGRYLITASKGGYLTTNYGAVRPNRPGTPVVLANGAHVTDRTIVLPKGSVIDGVVTDAAGQPAQDVTATAYRYALSQQTGERVLQRVATSQPTDDQGHYRIFGLEPGRYFVSAAWASAPDVDAGLNIRQITDADIQGAEQIISGRLAGSPAAAPRSGASFDQAVAFAPVYYPSAFVASDAAAVELGPQEERAGINILLRLTATARVEGVIAGADGVPAAGVPVTILDPAPKAAGVLASALGNTESDQAGHFVFRGISPGQYAIIASAMRAPSILWGSTDITVNGADVTASITLAPGAPVSGRIVFEGGSPPAFSSIRPILVPTNSLPARASPPVVSPDGTFTFASVQPGSFRLVINGGPPRGWAVRSITVDGHDALDTPVTVREGTGLSGITITFTDHPAEISGRMLDASGAPALEYFLVAFSADRQFWTPFSQRIRAVRPGLDGRYSVAGLPPGNYLISVLTDVTDGEWYDPQFLDALVAHGPIAVSLGAGETKVLDMQAKGGGVEPGR